MGSTPTSFHFIMEFHDCMLLFVRVNYLLDFFSGFC
jgi:hypothetical protein